MKKYQYFILGLLFCYLMTFGYVYAETVDNEVKVYLNEKQLIFDVYPQIENNKLFIPLSDISEILETKIILDADKKVIAVSKNNKTNYLDIGNYEVNIKNNKLLLYIPVRLDGGKTIVSLKSFSDCFEMPIIWNEQNNTILIFSSKEEYLAYAVLKNDRNKVSELLKEGANPNYKDSLERSLLEWAILDYDIFKLLVDYGANIDTKDKNGNSILYLAVLYSEEDIVKLLVEKNANLSIRGKSGKTPLELARGLRNTVVETYRNKYDNIIFILSNKDSNTTKVATDEADLNSLQHCPKPNISGIDQLEKYLSTNFSTVYTPTGVYHLTYNIKMNSENFWGYDYMIETNGAFLPASNMIKSINFSDEQKIITKQILTELQKEIAQASILALPNKKIRGGFFESFYKYPYLRVGYNDVEFLIWANYSHSISNDFDSMVYNDRYNNTKSDAFKWHPDVISHNTFSEKCRLDLLDISTGVPKTISDYNKLYKNSETITTWEKSVKNTNGYEWGLMPNEIKKQLISEGKRNFRNDNGYLIDDIYKKVLNNSDDWYISQINSYYNTNNMDSSISVNTTILFIITDECDRLRTKR